YFAIMWGIGYLTGRLLLMSYERTTTLAFTAAGNNFELAIAVAIATFGATSGQALAGVVGPLIEVPVLVGLVYVSLALRGRFPFARPRWRPAAGVSMTERPSVLYVCVHNAGRSQMAAAYTRALSDGAVEVRSAGSAPADAINSAVHEAMLEEGIDLSAERPK